MELSAVLMCNGWLSGMFVGAFGKRVPSGVGRVTVATVKRQEILSGRKLTRGRIEMFWQIQV